MVPVNKTVADHLPPHVGRWLDNLEHDDDDPKVTGIIRDIVRQIDGIFTKHQVERAHIAPVANNYVHNLKGSQLHIVNIRRSVATPKKLKKILQSELEQGARDEIVQVLVQAESRANPGSPPPASPASPGSSPPVSPSTSAPHGAAVGHSTSSGSPASPASSPHPAPGSPSTPPHGAAAGHSTSLGSPASLGSTSTSSPHGATPDSPTTPHHGEAAASPAKVKFWGRVYNNTQKTLDFLNKFFELPVVRGLMFRGDHYILRTKNSSGGGSKHH